MTESALLTGQRMPPAWVYKHIGIYCEGWRVHKFGKNEAITTLAPICIGGIYQTPTSAAALEILSDDGNDTSDGSGARKVRVYGIGSDYNELSEEVVMNGTTAVDLANSYLRVFRLRVTESGTYATASSASQKGTITLRADGGGATWAQIPEPITGFGAVSSQIGAYTIPAGWQAWLLSAETTIETTKNMRLFLFSRPGIDVTSAPYTPMTMNDDYTGLTETGQFDHTAHPEMFDEKTDIGFMAQAGNSASASIDFELLMIRKENWPY